MSIEFSWTCVTIQGYICVGECICIYGEFPSLCVSILAQVATPRMDMTLAELQEMAARQQQQIDAQQQLLASKVHRQEEQDERWDRDWQRWVDAREVEVKRDGR